MSIFDNPDVVKKCRIYIEARNKAYNKVRSCMLPHCHVEAINSHVIQRSKHLEPLQNKNKEMVALQSSIVYPGKLPKFKRVPILKILTFKGFCPLHDKQIFAEIEDYDIDINNKRHLLLLNYRSICHEMRKKMLIIEWMQDLINHPETSEEIKDNLKSSVKGFNLGIKDLQYYKSKIEQDLVEGTNNFKFFVEKLQRQEVVTSTIMGIDNILWKILGEESEEISGDEPLKSILFTIYPDETDTNLIIGFLEENENEVKEFIDELGGLNLDFVNKILLEWIETWAASEKFYLEKIKPIEVEVQRISMMAGVVYPQNESELPNLFK